MIDCIIDISIRYRWLAIAGGAALAAVGLAALAHTPVDAIPDLSENQVIVFTEWSGHGPQEIEDQVTYPLSLRLQGIPGVRVVRSSSDLNFSMIGVIFDEGVSWAAARERVAQRLAEAHDVVPPGVTPALAPDAAATGQIFWYTVEGTGSDLARLRALQDWYVRPQLSAVPGVAEVASVGGHVGEYAVEVDPRRLSALDLTLSDVVTALERANARAGGGVIHKPNAEFIVHSAGGLGVPVPGTSGFDPALACRDLENVLVPRSNGGPKPGAVRLADVAAVQYAPAPRRGILEKDGNEVVGGVVLMRQGENALAVTRRIREQIQSLSAGLPDGVRIVPFYDRTPLIEGSIATVTTTLLEAMLTATVCVWLVLRHFRAAFVVSAALPLAALASFIVMAALRGLGVADLQTNIMSMAGIAISIGALVDSSIVVAENVMHRLHERFGDRPVAGDTRELVRSACTTVGRPMFFAVVIMLLSFLPVFALGGIEGKMFRPLAFTKCFALVAVAVLAITLVPALCTVCIRGRISSESASWLVRSVAGAYRPMLAFVLDRPAVIVWIVGMTLVVGLTPLGQRWVLLLALGIAVSGGLWTAQRAWSRAAVVLTLASAAIIAGDCIHPLGYESVTPLDEGMVMDMPITAPFASVSQSADDLKARDMVLCRFPEVDMVVGKAGRADTSTDPAPLDMIETMVNFRPRELWPRRKFRTENAEASAAAVIEALESGGLIAPIDGNAKAGLARESAAARLPVFDAQMREYAYQRNREHERELGHALVRAGHLALTQLLYDNGSLALRLGPSEVLRLREPSAPDFALRLARDLTPEDVALLAHDAIRQLEQFGDLTTPSNGGETLRYRPGYLHWGYEAAGELFGRPKPTVVSRIRESLTEESLRAWREHIAKLNGELLERAPPVWTRLILDEILGRSTISMPGVAANLDQRRRLRTAPQSSPAPSEHHHGASASTAVSPQLDPCPPLDRIENEQARRLAAKLLLWPVERTDVDRFGGELDRAVAMPGWTNVWTMPIQNRVDMLATGVNTTVGVRVLGRNLDDVVRASDEVAKVVVRVPGAVNVAADRLRGKGYLLVVPDRDRAARLGVSVADITETVEVALGGKVVGQTVAARERHAIRLRYPADWRGDEEWRALTVPVRTAPGRRVALGDVADVRIAEGPATIKSENGLLRNYVRANVRGRDSLAFVEDAQRAVAAGVVLPPGVTVEWTGQFEHEQRANATLAWIAPLVLAVIFLVLWLTYRDLTDALLIMVAVPGALAGGILAQWLAGYKFSVTVWVGYIARFGMATATGIIMLVYLREALARAGGLERLTAVQLRQVVLDGAVKRLRPKLLTECTMVVGLAPLLWNRGIGANVIEPMVVPILGGILVADEVIDLLLPVLFYLVRKRRLERIPVSKQGKFTE